MQDTADTHRAYASLQGLDEVSDDVIVRHKWTCHGLVPLL
jgi:hypothetical protein